MSLELDKDVAAEMPALIISTFDFGFNSLIFFSS